jgi:hypothetical protein
LKTLTADQREMSEPLLMAFMVIYVRNVTLNYVTRKYECVLSFSTLISL